MARVPESMRRWMRVGRLVERQLTAAEADTGLGMVLPRNRREGGLGRYDSPLRRAQRPIARGGT